MRWGWVLAAGLVLAGCATPPGERPDATPSEEGTAPRPAVPQSRLAPLWDFPAGRHECDPTPWRGTNQLAALHPLLVGDDVTLARRLADAVGDRVTSAAKEPAPDLRGFDEGGVEFATAKGRIHVGNIGHDGRSLVYEGPFPFNLSAAGDLWQRLGLPGAPEVVLQRPDRITVSLPLVFGHPWHLPPVWVQSLPQGRSFVHVTMHAVDWPASLVGNDTARQVAKAFDACWLPYASRSSEPPRAVHSTNATLEFAAWNSTLVLLVRNAYEPPLPPDVCSSRDAPVMVDAVTAAVVGKAWFGCVGLDLYVETVSVRR